MKHPILILLYLAVLGIAYAGSAWQPEPVRENFRLNGDRSVTWPDETCTGAPDRISACLHRIEARRRIASDVLDGRLTLLAAAEHYRDLNETVADFNWEHFNYSSAGSEDERTCLQVIAFALTQVRGDPAQVAQVKERLENELCQYRQSGTLHLRR